MSVDESDKGSVSDETLVARCIRGDRRAFRCLYEKHIGRVYAICLRLCGDKDDASDVAQEVFIQIWGKLESYRGESVFSTWLYRVTSNTAISHIRKRKPWWTHGLDWSKAQTEEALVTEPVHFEHNLDRKILELPEQARLVFVLFAIEGYRHEEIAKMLGIAAGTSKAQYHRARQLLKEKIEHE